jgi:hypothetical protein
MVVRTGLEGVAKGDSLAPFWKREESGHLSWVIIASNFVCAIGILQEMKS